MLKPKLTVIIPVFNEKKTIEILLKKIFKIKISKQIIVVDDCSSDGTRNILKKYQNKIDKIIFHKKNLGKGSAIRSSQKFIRGDYVIIQDADLEYDPLDYIIMLDKITKSNLDVVYGSRVLKNSKFKNVQNFSHWARIFGNIFLTFLSNIINNQNLTDAHTCYKMFKSEVFKSIKLKEKGFSFCPEVTTKLSIKNIKIHEVSINYQGRSYEDGKKIVAFDGVRAIMTLVKYRFFDA